MNALKSVPSDARKAALHQSTSQRGLGNQELERISVLFVKNVSLHVR